MRIRRDAGTNGFRVQLLNTGVIQVKIYGATVAIANLSTIATIGNGTSLPCWIGWDGSVLMISVNGTFGSIIPSSGPAAGTPGDADLWLGASLPRERRQFPRRRNR